MTSVSRLVRLAGMWPAAFVRRAGTICGNGNCGSGHKDIGTHEDPRRRTAVSAPFAAVAFSAVPVLFSAPAAQAQCAAAGPIVSSPDLAPWTSAIGSGSASVSTIIASINSVNTAFLTQSSAFVGSPPNPQPDQQGGGVWARGVGGHFSNETTTVAGNINLDGVRGGNITCNTRTREDFAGVQVGADVARLNVNGWNLHAGLTSGYLGSSSQDATPAGLNPTASFRNSLQIPFIGVYGAASFGNWLFDGQVRGDFYQNEASDAFQGLGAQHFGARGLSMTGNVAWRQDLGRQWFVEPSAGLVWSRTHVDPLNYPGTVVTKAGAVPPWVLTVNDIDSTLGRFSVRAGTTIRSGNWVVQPFASAGVFHDFQRGATATLTSNFPAVGQSETYSSTISTAGVGTYGQFGLGVSAQIVDTGWVSYLRGDYRKGDSIEGWTLNGGVRYQFVPDTAPAAMAVKAPARKAPAVSAPYDWTGFYVGANAGAAWGRSRWDFAGDGAVSPHVAGFLAGGDIGYNYQAGKWVMGVEGAAGWTNARGARPCPGGFFYTCEEGFTALSTATGRIGYAFDRYLPYVKAGAVIAPAQARVVCGTGSQPTIVPLTGCPGQGDSKLLAGWTAGLGYEFGLTRNVSAKAEVMYFDLGGDSHSLAGVSSDLQRSGFMSTMGLRYRFGG
jgi:opacity protein-like surface antigen